MRRVIALIQRAMRKDDLRHDDAAQILAKIRRPWPESSIWRLVVTSLIQSRRRRTLAAGLPVGGQQHTLLHRLE